MRIRILILLLWMMVAGHAVAITLESMVITNRPNQATILCSFSAKPNVHQFTLTAPFRAIIDFDNTASQVNINSILHQKGLIEQLRAGNPMSKTLRLVFDSKQSVMIKTSAWKPANPRLVGLKIDISSKSHGIQTTSVQPIKAVLPPRPKPPKALRDVVIVLDPGHGGKDPGAMGMHHYAEKQVVLTIALKLKQLIDKQPGMRAILTRNGDYYVGLRQRMSIARRNNADIFVAIHADAFTNPLSNGASVFALSPRGATSEAARWLAEKENHSELGGVNLSGLDDQNGIIRTVLLDLSQTATIGASLQMGGNVLRHLDTVTNLHNNKVEQARFVVLKSPDIPSILIETGFISNAREERNLTNPAYQTRLTQAIFNGLKGYFWNYPPHGTRIEAMVSPGNHWVQSGETLPAIAARYHVSVAQLRRANGWLGFRLKPGQKLSIPASWA